MLTVRFWFTKSFSNAMLYCASLDLVVGSTRTSKPNSPGQSTMLGNGPVASLVGREDGVPYVSDVKNGGKEVPCS